MRPLFTTLALLAATLPARAEDYPHVVLKNEKLKLTVYEPDAKKGFYRGTRFDHAGVFGNVEFAGHKIFGPWKETHDPTNHDDIVGPCEEFGIEKPLGYDDAKVGGTFLKIGVGELEKPKEEKYSFAKKYKVVKPLEWKREKHEPDSLGRGLPPAGQHWLSWETSQKANGYGYEYSKMIICDEKHASLGILHTLKNTGVKRLVTDFYNHNFFNVDGDPVGPNYSLEFQFKPKAQDAKGKFGDLVELKEETLRFKDKLPTGDFVMAGLAGFDSQDEMHRAFRMQHAPSGIAVSAVHSYALKKVNVWGITTTICPEPFLAIDLKPGEEVKWDISYVFKHEPPKKK